MLCGDIYWFYRILVDGADGIQEEEKVINRRIFRQERLDGLEQKHLEDGD
jgi:hypothetical protein